MDNKWMCCSCHQIFSLDECKPNEVRDEMGYIMETEYPCPYCKSLDSVEFDDEEVTVYCKENFSCYDFITANEVRASAFLNHWWNECSLSEKLKAYIHIFNDNPIVEEKFIQEYTIDEYEKEFKEACFDDQVLQREGLKNNE